MTLQKQAEAFTQALDNLLGLLTTRGGPGSGHHGHRGRLGEVGGSLPAGVGALPPIPHEAHRPEPADQEKYLYKIGERVVMNWGVEGRVIAYFGGPPDPLFYIEYLTGPDAGLVRNHPHSSFMKKEDAPPPPPTVSWEYDEDEAWELEKASIKEFGETENPREAGYILSEGQMLDFSGKREGGPAGTRSYDHRDIGRVLPDEAPGGTDGMTWFMVKTGAIRMGMYDTDFIIDLARPPTNAQDRRVRELLEWSENLVVDISDQQGNTLWSTEESFEKERAWNITKRKAEELLETRSLVTLVFRGGPGSGHHRHRGRPGKVGGSLPGEGIGPITITVERPVDETKTGLWLRGKEYLKKYGAKHDPDAGWYFSAFKLVKDRDPLFAIDKQGKVIVGLTGHQDHLDLMPYGEESIRGFSTYVGAEPVLVYYRTGFENLDMLFRRWEELLEDMGYPPEQSLTIMVSDDAGWSMRFPTSEDAELFPPPDKYRSFIEKGGRGSGHHGHKGRPGEVGGSLPKGAVGVISEKAPLSVPEFETKEEYIDYINENFMGKNGLGKLLIQEEELESKQYEKVMRLEDYREMAETFALIKSLFPDLKTMREYEEFGEDDLLWEILYPSYGDSSYKNAGGGWIKISSWITKQSEKAHRTGIEAKMMMLLSGGKLSQDERDEYSNLSKKIELLDDPARHKESHSRFWVENRETDQFKGAMLHEFGHYIHLHDHFRRYEDALLGSFTNNATWRQDYGITHRSRDNWRECMAENFAIWAMGHRDVLHPEIVNWFDQLSEEYGG